MVRKANIINRAVSITEIIMLMMMSQSVCPKIVLLLFRIVPTHNALHLHDDNCYMCVSSCTLYSLHSTYTDIYKIRGSCEIAVLSRAICRHRERFEIIICNLFLSEEIRDSFGHCVDFILNRTITTPMPYVGVASQFVNN